MDTWMDREGRVGVLVRHVPAGDAVDVRDGQRHRQHQAACKNHAVRGNDRQRQAATGNDRQRQATTDSDRQRQAVTGSDRQRQATTGSDRQ
eukprot:173676-Chlamydomonas_euryale.AAC.2